MSLTPEAKQANIEHIVTVLGEEVAKTVSDENFEAALAETVSRGEFSRQTTVDSALSTGDLISFEVVVNRKDGSSASDIFRKRPTPEGLLFLLANNCSDGDKLEVTTTFEGGAMTVTDYWPLSYKTAVKMVEDVRENPSLYQTDKAGKKFGVFKLKNFGKVSYQRENLTETQNIPDVIVKKGVRDGKPYVMFGAAWLKKSFAVVLMKNK